MNSEQQEAEQKVVEQAKEVRARLQAGHEKGESIAETCGWFDTIIALSKLMDRVEQLEQVEGKG